MDSPTPRPRHLADRARLQPAGRRLARRLRPAVVAVLLCACGQADRPHEDFKARLLENRWDGVGAWRVEDFIAGMRAYIDGDYPIYPDDHAHAIALHEFLFREKPDPLSLVPLFGPFPRREDVDEQRLRADLVAVCVVTSFIRRAATDPDDPQRAALYDAVVAIGIPFAFDPAWGDSHTATSIEVTDFFADGRYPVNEHSRAAIARHFPALLKEWRARVTDKGSSMFFGVTLRHMGAAGAAALCGEWGRMGEREREDLLRRLANEDEASRVVRSCMVEALLDGSPDVQEAALFALEEHEAPLGNVDLSAREADLEHQLAPLRRWAQETES